MAGGGGGVGDEGALEPGGGGGGSSSSNGGALCKAEGITPTGSRRLLECEHCHKQFTSRFNLQRHQLIHTGAKPYECPLCHQRFNQSGHVKTHLRTRHPNHEIQSMSDSNSM
ncbi:UNVERIFIED_CONTAM: hypothetical protein GTU68_050377 [Idotea baltica]|nr:hypothetical protein [Idotea baltica]